MSGAENAAGANSQLAVPPSVLRPADKTESTSERAGNVAVARVSTAANPLRTKERREEGRKNIGEGEQEIRNVVR